MRSRKISAILFVIVRVARCEKSWKRVTPPLQLEFFFYSASLRCKLQEKLHRVTWPLDRIKSFRIRFSPYWRKVWSFVRRNNAIITDWLSSSLSLTPPGWFFVALPLKTKYFTSLLLFWAEGHRVSSRVVYHGLFFRSREWCKTMQYLQDFP